MLVQFAQMGSAFAQARHRIADPTVALLSIGEEPSKGTPVVKESHQILAGAPGVRFVGNVEGRDLLNCPADVVVTDGFTGNVALKTLEGSLRFFMSTLFDVFATDEVTKAAADALMPYLQPIAEALDPENTGGAMLLGVGGVCVISHGSSSAVAIHNAIRVARGLVDAGLVEHLAQAVAS